MNDPMAGTAPCPAGPPTAPATGSAVIVADVGGTYARLAWTPLQPGTSPAIRDFRRYACADHPSLAAILRGYAAALAADPAVPPAKSAVVAIAGLLEGDRLLNTNLAWPVSVEATRREAGLDALELINDFAAVAHAIPHADPGTMSRLAGDGPHVHRWPALVLGPGTGLGAALRLEGGPRPVLPSEVGHSALAPGNALELDILRLLMRRHAHVDNERVLSGPGLVNLYDCLCELRGTTPCWRSPAELIEAARQGGDALAAESIHVFCGWLGSLVGDLAIAFGAKAVYLTGGITGHIAGQLHDGHFLQRYLAKGALSQALRQVPVWRVDHGQLGVLGAAAWHAEGGSDTEATDTGHGECR